MEEINEVVALITPDIRFDRDLILAIIDLLNAYEAAGLPQHHPGTLVRKPSSSCLTSSAWSNVLKAERYRQERSDTVSWRGKRRD